MDIIQIQGLKVLTLVGIEPFEQQLKQNVVMDIDLSLDTQKAAQSDDLSHSIDYSQVVDFIMQYCQDHHFGLLETLGHRLADHILNRYPIAKITLNLRKPHILAHCQSVGIQIEKHAHHQNEPSSI